MFFQLHDYLVIGTGFGFMESKKPFFLKIRFSKTVVLIAVT